MFSVWIRAAGAAFLFAAASLVTPPEAEACGGTFCNATLLQPVAQNAERVLFEVLPDDQLRATVEIRYDGDPEDFAWVVPVPDVPELDTDTPAGLLAGLDQATAPTFNNRRRVCGDDVGGGCSPRGSSVAALATVPIAGLTGCADSALFDPAEQGSVGGVNVEDSGRVGPYDFEVVSSDDPEAMIAWLNTNDYLITPEMEPAVEGYVTGGMKFLAMKLDPAAGVQDITPLRMTYPGTHPMVPIVLTSVAAEPEMGVLVFIAAEQRFQARDWPNILVDPRDVWVDLNSGRTNYYGLISWILDDLGGFGFITESAGPDTSGFLAGDYVTRMYTRLSAWEMTQDPVFIPSDGGDISNVVDLQQAEPIDVCEGSSRDACGDQYCGPGASCAVTDQGAGCVCPAGTVATTILEPGLGALVPKVHCERLDFDMMGSVPDLIVNAPDPCLNVDCGGGTCTPLNGFPTCSCESGFAAVVLPTQPDRSTCVPILEELDGDTVIPSIADVDENAATAAISGPRTLAGHGVLMLLVVAAFRARRRS